MTKLAEMDLPTLEGGWLALSEAAELLSFSRAYMYKLVSNGSFDTARRIGTAASYVINRSEVDALINARIPDPETEAEAAQDVTAPTNIVAKELSMEEMLNKL